MGQQVVSKYAKDDLFALIKDVMGIKSITPMIQRQVNKFILEYDMTFKEIARCIVYYVEVRGGVLDTMYGLGIIPNIREQAGSYFKQLELDQQKQLAEAQKIVEYQDNNIIFNIKSLKHKKRQPKQINIADIDVEGEE
jgi:hypothetical protein